MAKRQDFLLQKYNYNGKEVWDFPLDDFTFNGILQSTPYGDSDNQHKLDITVNNIGAIKKFPLLGFGVFKYQNSEYQSGDMFNSFSQNMKSDLYNTGVGAIKQVGDKNISINLDLVAPSY